MKQFYDESLVKGALTVIKDVCGVKKGDRVLIVTNPQEDVLKISMALYDATVEAEGVPVLAVQNEKTLLDYCDRSIVAAIKTEPQVIFSISANKLGKDEEGMAEPYTTPDGQEFTSAFNYLMDGVKHIRAVWTPGITVDMFARTTDIDYALLKTRCEKLCRKYDDASFVHVTAPAGTDMIVPVEGRKGLSDDGDFSFPGAGGNIPAGEVFVSPVVGKSSGTIVFDGSISLTGGDLIINEPIFCKVVDGYVTDIFDAKSNPPAPESDAGKLLQSVTDGETRAVKMGQEGILSAEKAALYAKNARNIGELGIGLNPAAEIRGNMLEDEKAFRTCHFAIGLNYDNDAPALIHFDGVIKNPTIVIHYKDGSTFTVETDGVLNPELS